MSDQEKRQLVRDIEALSTEKKLMTLGFVKGLAASAVPTKNENS